MAQFASRARIRMLTEARIAAGLTQGDWAKRLGCHQSLISKYERGERRIDVIEFLVLSEAVDIEAGILIQRLER
jgi:transcriptional regulator with XRE-family HTH domain